MPFTPIFGVLDITNNQIFYLCVINLATSLFLVFKSKNIKMKIIRPLFIYALFILFNGISVLYSDYFLISLKEFNIYLVVFFSLFIMYQLINIDRNNLILFKYIFLVLLIIEVGVIQYNFITEFSILNPLGRDFILEGITFNLNVAAFSILIKLPFLLFLLKKSSAWKSTLLSFILFSSVFTILILSSRGAILGYGILSLSTLILGILFLKSSDRKSALKIFFINLSCGIIAFSLQNFLYQNQQTLKASERMQNFSGDSVGMRLGFYEDTIEHFLSYPFIGSGIGTWKINSIKYHSKDQDMVDYQVPYHAHNDFLQILTELGLVGSLVYLLIFLTLLYELAVIFFKKNKTYDRSFIYFSIIAIGIYLLDANINFPRVRAINQLSLIYIFSCLFHIVQNTKTYKTYSSKPIMVLILFLQPFLILYNYKLILDSQNSVQPFIEYNNTRDLSMPLNKVLEIDESFSPVNSVTVPLKNVKATYLIENKKYEEAIKYAREGKKYNPYLYMAENQIAKAYLKMNKKDSAVYYAKIAFDNLSNNLLHATVYQQTLYDYHDTNFAKKEYYRIYNFFKKAKNRRIEAGTTTVLENLLKFFLVSSKKIEIDEVDKKTSQEIVKRFPKNTNLLKLNSVIQNGTGKTQLSNEFDNEAKIFFEKKEFNEAISIWEKAILLLPTEEAYYLNLAQSYIALSNVREALVYLRKIEELSIKGVSGKFEFLLALCNIELKNNSDACVLLKKSHELGYENSYGVLKALNCF